MQFQKRHLLLVIALICLVLWYFGSENIPFLQHLPTIAGSIHAFNLLANLAQQPNYEQLSTDTQSTHNRTTDTKHN